MYKIQAAWIGFTVAAMLSFSASAQDAVRQNFIVLQKPYDLEMLRRSLADARAWRDRQDEIALRSVAG